MHYEPYILGNKGYEAVESILIEDVLPKIHEGRYTNALKSIVEALNILTDATHRHGANNLFLYKFLKRTHILNVYEEGESILRLDRSKLTPILICDNQVRGAYIEYAYERRHTIYIIRFEGYNVLDEKYFKKDDSVELILKEEIPLDEYKGILRFKDINENDIECYVTEILKKDFLEYKLQLLEDWNK